MHTLVCTELLPIKTQEMMQPRTEYHGSSGEPRYETSDSPDGIPLTNIQKVSTMCQPLCLVQVLKKLKTQALPSSNLPFNRRDTGGTVVNNLPIQEMQIRSLGWEDPLKDDGNPLQCSCLENPHGQRSLAGYGPQHCKESDATE